MRQRDSVLELKPTHIAHLMNKPMTLNHLTMSVSISARCNYQLRQAIALGLHFIPGSRTLLRYAQKIVTHLSNIDNAFTQTRVFEKRIAEGPNASLVPQAFDSGFGYGSEFRELEIADHYREQLIQGNWDDQKTESGDLYDAVIPLLGRHIESMAIQKVLNFGVSYGHVDSKLAGQYPHVQFTGIDRSSLTKFYNEQFFNIRNLEFVAGDVFECIVNRTWSNSLFFHMRTLTCLPQEFVEDLYARCYRAGFECIIGAEQCGLSWQTGKPYSFSLSNQKSVVFRNYMFIHNYPGLLQAAGYRMIEARLLKTRHPDPNFRLLVFVAQRAI